MSLPGWRGWLVGTMGVLLWESFSSELHGVAPPLLFATEIATFGCKPIQSAESDLYWSYCFTIERTEECFRDY